MHVEEIIHIYDDYIKEKGWLREYIHVCILWFNTLNYEWWNVKRTQAVVRMFYLKTATEVIEYEVDCMVT